jgi:hypothetical protein
MIRTVSYQNTLLVQAQLSNRGDSEVVSPPTFLLLNLALAFYNVGAIWAHEVDIFRSWKLIGRDSFNRVQTVLWRKLPYWVFMPVGLGFLGSIALICTVQPIRPRGRYGAGSFSS